MNNLDLQKTKKILDDIESKINTEEYKKHFIRCGFISMLETIGSPYSKKSMLTYFADVDNTIDDIFQTLSIEAKVSGMKMTDENVEIVKQCLALQKRCVDIKTEFQQNAWKYIRRGSDLCMVAQILYFAIVIIGMVCSGHMYFFMLLFFVGILFPPFFSVWNSRRH